MKETTITFGGFIKENIRQALIKECIESGDPDNYLFALMNEIEELYEDVSNDPDFWKVM